MRLQPNDAILYESLGKDTHTHENTRPEYNKSTTDSGQKGAVGGGRWAMVGRGRKDTCRRHGNALGHAKCVHVLWTMNFRCAASLCVCACVFGQKTCRHCTHTLTHICTCASKHVFLGCQMPLASGKEMDAGWPAAKTRANNKDTAGPKLKATCFSTLECEFRQNNNSSRRSKSSRIKKAARGSGTLLKMAAWRDQKSLLLDYFELILYNV